MITEGPLRWHKAQSNSKHEFKKCLAKKNLRRKEASYKGEGYIGKTTT